MLDGRMVKTLDREGCLEHKENYEHELDLTNRRLERLLKKQVKNPDFKSYDAWADGMVNLPTRIEEQETVKDELEWCIELLNDRLGILSLRVQYPGAKIFNPNAAQLNLFDGAL